MLDPDVALDLIRKISHQPQTEEVPLTSALGRVLAEELISSLDSPPFAKAAMDGYAVRLEDNSQSFRLLETIAAGDIPAREVRQGRCAKIMTGAMMPAGAEKVIRLEYTEEKDGLIRLLQAEPHNNVIQKGENLRKGERVLEPRVIKPQDIGVLASLGLDRVKVALPPLVGIIATGLELRNPGQTLRPGEIYNSNGLQLCAQTAAVGGQYKNYGIVPDEPKELKAVISEALVECDVVLVSGGVSMGEFDFVPEVLKENGVQIRFHKLAVKPGKPTLFGRKDETFVFGLPGNPVSTFVIFEVFVKTLLYRWMGINYDPVLLKARLSKAIKRRDSKRLEFRPVKVTGGEIHPISYHGSSHLNVLSQTNGLLRIERGVDFVEEGRELYVRQI